MTRPGRYGTCCLREIDRREAAANVYWFAIALAEGVVFWACMGLLGVWLWIIGGV